MTIRANKLLDKFQEAMLEFLESAEYKTKNIEEDVYTVAFTFCCENKEEAKKFLNIIGNFFSFMKITRDGNNIEIYFCFHPCGRMGQYSTLAEAVVMELFA